MNGLEYFDHSELLTVEEAMYLLSAIEKKYPQPMEKIERLKENYPTELGKAAVQLFSTTLQDSLRCYEIFDPRTRYGKFRDTFGQVIWNEVAHWFSWWM